jgi:hypothetical protein
LAELNIDIICANSPQAKGRVERMNQTLQDRLVKELRLRGISTMEAGNAFLPKFIDDWRAELDADRRRVRVPRRANPSLRLAGSAIVGMPSRSADGPTQRTGKVPQAAGGSPFLSMPDTRSAPGYS